MSKSSTTDTSKNLENDELFASEKKYSNHEFSNHYNNHYEKSTPNSMVKGSALQTLAVHRPTSFTLDPSLDASKIAVIVTGK